MKITFVVPFVSGICGGVKAVFEFADQLKQRGHEVSIVYPLIPHLELKSSFLGMCKGMIVNLIRGNRVGWFHLKSKLVRVPTLAEKYMPNADVVVATWWETAYSVSRLSEKKGKKFYLVQHYEIWGGPEEMVDQSYKLGLKIVVNSTWLKNLLWEKLQVKSEALIIHAPAREQFYPQEVKKNKNEIRVLMPYRQETWKGVEDGIKAFEIAKFKFKNTKLVMFGSAPKKNIPEYAEFHQRPNNNKLRQIYNSCDIFLFPSLTEGFGMPPMEAMACRIPVATTNVGAMPDYAVAGETALVSEPSDFEALAKNLIILLEDKEKREKIAENGYNHIKQFTWEAAAEQLEKTFLTTK